MMIVNRCTQHTPNTMGRKETEGKEMITRIRKPEKNTEKGKTKGKKGGNVRPRSLLKPLFALLDVLVKEHS